VLDEGIDRGRFREVLAGRGIQTSVHYPPAHHFSIYAGRADLPRSDAYGARVVTLPMFATMTSDQQDAVIEAVHAALEAGVPAR
jgi:dTDP-4-amino-4,6-dideoxygalactose transaminase